jgi:hypothetical protein
MHKKKILGCHMKDSFDWEHKKNLFFGNLSWMFIFENTLNANLLYVFYK